MDKIDVQVLNPEVLSNCERMVVCAARLTQRGHKITNMEDFMELYNKEYTPTLIEKMCKLPHPTIQKFGVINVAVVGASRRFLAQITRHQNEVKFMSASLQYSNYGGAADFVIPYDVIQAGKQDEYIETSENIQIEFLGLGSNIYEGGKPQMYFAVFLKDVDLKTYFYIYNKILAFI